MQRAVVLLILALISVAFLLIQITVVRRLENGGKGGFHLLPSFLKAWTFKKPENLFLTLIEEVAEICSKNNIIPFIIDRQILQNISRHRQSSKPSHPIPFKRCRYLCQRKTVSLGVLASNWDNQVLEDLQQSNIKFTEITGQDPRQVTIERTTRKLIPLHFILSRGQHILHISLFYERGHLGLWHGSISKQDLFMQSFVHGSKREEILPIDGHFQNEGVLDRFSIETVKVDGILLSIPAEIHLFLEALTTFLPCNFKRARAFYAEYGEDNSHEAKLFRKRGRDVLQITKKNLDVLGVRFWLSSGTCLGWFRQCNIISHSQDMDIGIWIKDYNKQLISKFHEDGLYLHHILGKVEDSYQMSFRTIDGVRLDIFFFYEEGTYMWNGGTRAKTGAKFKYLFPNFSLCWAEYLEMKVRVPCDTLSYVEANYGKHWSSQIKQWDWKSSPSNVIENGKWDEKELSEVVQFFELQ